MDSLANEVLIQIFAYSNTSELGLLMRCSRKFLKLITDDYMWKEAFRKRWGDGHSLALNWRQEYCKRANESDFWNDCVLNGKSLLLKNWIRDPVLDYSFHPPTGVLKVISLTGIHSCRLLDSSSSSSTTTASASFERFSSYFPSALQATTARFLKGGNNLAVGMPDGDLYLTQDFSLPERETFHDLLSTGRRLNSSALRMPVKGIEALGDDLLLVAYQGDKAGYFQLAIWKWKRERKWLWHVGEVGVIDWTWRVRENHHGASGKEVIVVVAVARSVKIYRFVIESSSAGTTATTVIAPNPTNMENFLPLAQAEASWTLNDAVIEQVSFASDEHLLIRTGTSIEILKLASGDCAIDSSNANTSAIDSVNDSNTITFNHSNSNTSNHSNSNTSNTSIASNTSNHSNTIAKLTRSLALKCTGMWTGEADGIVLLSSPPQCLSLLNCQTFKVLQLPIPSNSVPSLRGALIGEVVCLAFTRQGVLVYDSLNGSLLSVKNIPGMRAFGDSIEIKADDSSFKNITAYCSQAQRLQLLQFVDTEVHLLQKKKDASSNENKKRSSASPLLRQELADWSAERQEEVRLDALRQRFNFDEMSEDQMLRLAILMSGGNLSDESGSGAESGNDTDLEIALRLSLQEQ